MLNLLSGTQKNFGDTAVDGTLYECKASPDLIAAFEKRAIKVISSEGEVLFNNGEPGKCVYLILAGQVDLFLPLSSKKGIGFRAQAGAFVGLPAAFSNEAYSMTAIAREGAKVAVMSRDKLCDLVAADPVLALDVLRILAAETRAARITIVEAEIGRRKQVHPNPQGASYVIR
jgi:CRP/FNR family transcriptional regulator, cyclic AMP receptor protein